MMAAASNLLPDEVVADQMHKQAQPEGLDRPAAMPGTKKNIPGSVYRSLPGRIFTGAIPKHSRGTPS
jgi:hypothetical protein